MMIRTDGAILFVALVLFHSLFSLTSSSSCNAADHEHQGAIAVHDHDHAHDHDHSNHHDHGHSHAHDHGHSHAHGDGCVHDYHVSHTDSHHDHGHHYHHDHAPADDVGISKQMLAEELAEEEELRLYGFMSNLHMEEAHHHEQGPRGVGLWMRALGCSLLVSMASLICLIILPLIVSHGKPSRTVVDFLAAFGAGAMLGDAFLHQLPHALGGSHTHPHSHGPEHKHEHLHGHHEGMGHSHDGDHGHAHSIEDLSVGLAVLAGVILFFIVEKIVRQVEKSSSKEALPWAHRQHHHHHHHHHHGRHNEDESIEQHLNEVDERKDGEKSSADDTKIEDTSETSANGSFKHESSSTAKPYRRKKSADIHEESEALKSLPEKEDSDKRSSVVVAEQAVAPNLILGYLNLFSDGVHNFTDGMALGAAFLNHGTLGGWSRTLFLLAHELPQEVGDFGILVQSGFSVVKALAFNFLSALVALAGTVVALVLGGNPGHSSLIEGFTAGGFIYIAVAGVLPEMHQHGTSPKSTIIQLIALILGMSVALTISLVE